MMSASKITEVNVGADGTEVISESSNPRYGKEEFARRSDESYESQVRLQVEEGNYGKIVAIDSALVRSE